MKLTVLLAPCLLAGSVRAATIVTETFTMSTSAVIPDADLSGVVQTLTPATTLASIDLITVTLQTTGGWNGDLYAYLLHDGVLSVLVNRPGRTAVLPDGSATSGMTLQLADAATTDLHLAPGALTGTFQPDGRNIHPALALDTTPRTGQLADFTPTAPGGAWHLFIADVAGGEEATLTGWSLSLTGPMIPEPSSTALVLAAPLALLTRRRRA